MPLPEVPHELVRRKHHETTCFAIIHPDTREELGRFYSVPIGWRVLMPDPNTRECTVLVPDVFPTRYSARKYILEAHTPEAE